MMNSVRVGTAGWNVSKETAGSFSSEGSHLERYSSGFNVVEINSSFYRAHRRSTYERWAASVPDGFRFSVKMPKQITHANRLENSDSELDEFTAAASGLGEKLGPVLVQLPPSLVWCEKTAERFFCGFRVRHQGEIVCEPRHKSWFSDKADDQMKSLEISRVAADPAIIPSAANPGGDRKLCYFRWHGSPRTYYSSYDEPSLRNLSHAIQAAKKRSQPVWCIFDNTAANAAIPNALTLLEMLRG